MTAALLASLRVRFCLQEKEATSRRRWRRWKVSSETRREKVQKRQKICIKDSGSTQGNKDIELKMKKKRRGEKPHPTLFFTRRRISPENEAYSEAALNLIFIELGCMCNIWTEFCRVDEEKEFGGGLAVWGGRNLAECGGH